MSTKDDKAHDLQRAWTMLGLVERHPRVQQWFEELDSHSSRSARCVASESRVSRRAWFSVGVAALVACTVAGSVVGYLHFAAPHYTTGVGEQRDVVLGDGSRIVMNTNTALTVRYSDTRRVIELEQGEALFAVERDSRRPFEVTAGATVTQALGTEFNVDLRKTSVTVSVLEGVVKVALISTDSMNLPTEDAAPSFAALSKGQALEFNTIERRTYQVAADTRRIDAWRTRRLEFRNTPLSRAVEELNRYSTARVVISSPELGAVRVSGVFRIGDISGFLFSVQETLGVELHESPDEVILMPTQRTWVLQRDRRDELL